MTAPIRVLVADDHPAVRSGLVTLLGTAPDITVVAEAGDGDAAVRLALEVRPDVVLTDVRMPGATGIDITPRLRASGARVLVVSGFDLDAYVLGALAAGADGYLVKTEEPRRILQAVRDVHQGDAVLSATATRTVLDAMTDRPAAREDDGAEAPGPGLPEPVFTPREEDVLRLVAAGHGNQRIARDLYVEVSTVKSHLSHALRKLGLDSRVQAALWWRRHRG